MRYRRLDANLDYVFGNGAADFLVNSPATVAQLIETRLRLQQSEWFLDSTAGVPWFTQIMGSNTGPTRDLALRTAILQTQGVTKLLSYSSTFNPATRVFTVDAEVLTQYSQQPVNVSVPMAAPA